MLKTGVCSVTFRQESIATIINLAVQAELDGIEWAGDVHVPPGNPAQAAATAKKTEASGLEVSSYGSYYRTGAARHDYSFETILETALALNAPSIRVWAGEKESRHADASYRQRVADDAVRIASLAQEKGVEVHFEYHGGTLTDTRESARKLMEETSHPNLKLYWQPAVGQDLENRLADIKEIKPWLKHVHVFFWVVTERWPLLAGEKDWKHYLSLLSDTEEKRYFMLEFVQNDDKNQFLEDAEVLRTWLEEMKYHEL
ncbi:sugar phosphate isomerase/epimerase family protein [Salibacterium aidingense]|uniref:sugar phosphate isomerase/epimerase family protein n=1 Tax=Salibacterium aidingense TaxID=384933 RepID=UPI003BC84264